MNLKRREKARKGVTTVLVVALVAGLAYVASGFIVRHIAPRFQLTSGTGTPAFSITGAVEGTPASYPTTSCSGSAAKLYPGTERCLLYTVKNPLSVSLTVTSLTVTSVSLAATTSTHPSCSPAKSTFTTFTATAFSGHLFVGAKSGAVTGSATEGRPITWKSTGVTQDPCAGAKFTFHFHGVAAFTDESKTVLASGIPNPALPGATVTFTATVTGTHPTLDTAKPSGKVGFYKCASATTCASGTLLGTGTITTSTGKATFKSHTLPVGKTYVQARFTTSGHLTDFAPSRSSIVTEFVGSTCGTLQGCLKFKTEPETTQTGHIIHAGIDSTGTYVILEVVRATGSVVTTFSGTITVTLLGSPPSSTLSGTKTVTFVTGLATFSTLSITHAGSYRLHATASPTTPTALAPTPTTSTRFNVDTRLVHCTSNKCSTTQTVTNSVLVTETSTGAKGGFLALGFSGAQTFTCGTTSGVLKGQYVATADVYTSTGKPTPQNGTTWMVTYTISKTIVKTTGPTGASKWQVCFASTTTFTALTGPANKVTLTTGGGPVPYYVGLLQDCSKTVKAPCVESRNKTKAGQEVITVHAAGDGFIRP